MLPAYPSTVVAVLVIYFAIRYRRRSEDEFPEPIVGSHALEIAWSAIPRAAASSAPRSTGAGGTQPSIAGIAASEPAGSSGAIV